MQAFVEMANHHAQVQHKNHGAPLIRRPHREIIMEPPPPDSRSRQQQADFKGYLDFDGKDIGVYSYWNLARVEKEMSIYRSALRQNGSIRLLRIKPAYPDVVASFYNPFKSLIVNYCTTHAFRGGAFAEKVRKESALNDILQFIYWSPVMTKEHRYFFSKEILDLYQEVMAHLKEPSTPEDIDYRFMAKYIQRLENVEQYFETERVRPVPIPTDISDEWLEEFGPLFTENYRQALEGRPDAPFKVQDPIRDQYGMTMKGYNDIDIEEMYPIRFATQRMMSTQDTAFSQVGAMDYGRALSQIADRESLDQARARENLNAGVGPKMAPPIRDPEKLPLDALSYQIPDWDKDWNNGESDIELQETVDDDRDSFDSIDELEGRTRRFKGKSRAMF
ncbi:hypothetical protein HYFRA_00001501 [Hymenoscyphus fraxineus]|uniref:Uncharacterized protein n=1 Tax=Hymenoscyphus fraxineus TaxID=746836 RepID=A0A9N9PMG1_9HELO|nr:hypothetical protein HYFRA_00001501 [Hymenoscyphus fraxineus]